jgi:hypothetical protein
MKIRKLQIHSAVGAGNGDSGREDRRDDRRGPRRAPRLRSCYRLKEKVATSASIAISVVTRVPGAGPAGLWNGPLTRFLNTW